MHKLESGTDRADNLLKLPYKDLALFVNSGRLTLNTFKQNTEQDKETRTISISSSQ